MRFFKRLLAFVISMAFIAAPFIVWWQWHAIYDFARLHNYSPPTSISTLAAQDTMTAYSKHIFYVNHPQLLAGVNEFRQDCPESEQTIVLGCYHPDEEGIYIYNVQDSQLYGIQQVTAAHEMLHGAYERLSKSDRNYVDGLLNDFYNNDEHDQRIIDEINLYKKTEPNSVMDEMHSVFGTEISALPAPLETYYQRYFTNRAVIADFANGYQSAFTSRSNQINSDDDQLATMKTQISAEEQSLSTQLTQINTDRAKLDALKSSGQISAYNSGITSFNTEVDNYNAGVTKLQSDIAAYNTLVNTRNAIAGELRSLDSAIDTRLTTQSAQ